MVIQVCIGSACHLKGSYEVIEAMKQLISQHQLEQKIELKSSFCLGACGNGVSVKVDNEPVVSLSPNNVEAFLLALGTD
jgi:NADH:ubiquinone oxidoreductase subunit E